MPHPTGSDAGWNSAQHPTWPRALSEELDPAVMIAEWDCDVFGASSYWGTPTNKCVTKPQPLKWTNKWVFNGWNEGLMLGGNYFHPASPVDFHPASRRKIRPWYLTLGNIPRLHISPTEVKSHVDGYSWLNLRKTNRRLQTSMPWLATLRAPPWMLGGIPPSVTVSGLRAQGYQGRAQHIMAEHKNRLSWYGIPSLKIRRSWDRLIFITGILYWRDIFILVQPPDS